VDELPELDEIYSANPNPRAKVVSASDVTTPQNLPAESPNGSIAVVSTASDDPAPWTPRSLYSGTQVTTPSSKRRRPNDDRSSFHSISHTSPERALLCHEAAHSFHRASSYDRNEDAIGSLLRAADFSDHEAGQATTLLHSPSLDPGPSFTIEAQPETPGIWPHSSVQEACLMRYFIDELACWVRFDPVCHILFTSLLYKFDLCDPERHFAFVVPQRARQCPALLNAIFTASARHLCRLDQYRKGDAVEYLDKRLADLYIETAVEYHRRCIEHLVSVSDDPEAVFDENILVASIILRFMKKSTLLLTEETGKLDSEEPRSSLKLRLHQGYRVAFNKPLSALLAVKKCIWPL
jgi:hypothetical protein